MTTDILARRCPSIFCCSWRFGEERLRGMEREETIRGKETSRSLAMVGGLKS
jgi:hypothetical protein